MFMLYGCKCLARGTTQSSVSIRIIILILLQSQSVYWYLHELKISNVKELK
jgi:hypothetical protein